MLFKLLLVDSNFVEEFLKKNLCVYVLFISVT